MQGAEKGACPNSLSIGEPIHSPTCPHRSMSMHTFRFHARRKCFCLFKAAGRWGGGGSCFWFAFCSDKDREVRGGAEGDSWQGRHGGRQGKLDREGKGRLGWQREGKGKTGQGRHGRQGEDREGKGKTGKARRRHERQNEDREGKRQTKGRQREDKES